MIDQRWAVIAHLDIAAALDGEAKCRLVLVDLEAGRHAGKLCVAARDWERRSDVFSIPTDELCVSVPVGGIAPAEPEQISPEHQFDDWRAEVKRRYGLLNDDQKLEHMARKASIDTSDPAAMLALLDELEPFNRPSLSKATCWSCGAAIHWAVTAKGHGMPIDVESVADGNVYLDSHGIAHVLGAQSELVDAAQPRYVSHFATCPNADQHRKRDKPAKPDEGGPVDEATLTVLRERFEGLDMAGKLWISTLVTEGRNAGVEWRTSLLPSLRRYELGRAVVHLAEADLDDTVVDDVIRGLLGHVTGREEVEQSSLPLGAAIGTLDAGEAARFALAVDAYLALAAST